MKGMANGKIFIRDISYGRTVECIQFDWKKGGPSEVVEGRPSDYYLY